VPGQTLNVRIEDDLAEWIDSMAGHLEDTEGGKVTRSTIVRYILRRARNEPALQAMLKEEMAALHGALQSRMHRIHSRMREAVEEELLTAFQGADSPALSDGETPDELDVVRRRSSKARAG
jgi:hypothetical protein